MSRADTRAIMVGSTLESSSHFNAVEPRTYRTRTMGVSAHVGQLEADPGDAVQDDACCPNQAEAGLNYPAARAEIFTARDNMSVERRMSTGTGQFQAERRVAIQTCWLKNRV